MNKGPYQSPYYTVYLEEREEVIAFGRYDVCAKMLGVTLGSFYSILSRAKKSGNRGKYAVVVEKVSGVDAGFRYPGSTKSRPSGKQRLTK